MVAQSLVAGVIPLLLIEVNAIKPLGSVRIGNQTFVSNSQQTRNANCLPAWCVWERRPGTETLVVENKHRMTHMGHSHTPAISSKMLGMKNLFPGACDEPIERW
jgi:hypothetical protein